MFVVGGVDGGLRGPNDRLPSQSAVGSCGLCSSHIAH